MWPGDSVSPASAREEAGDTESPGHMLISAETFWTLSPPGGRGQGEVGRCGLLLLRRIRSALPRGSLSILSLIDLS